MPCYKWGVPDGAQDQRTGTILVCMRRVAVTQLEWPCMWQVFVSEQLLYTRPELERHKRTGDTEGPLAESGFRGHAHCRFCRRYFFSDNELFAHMQTEHEHCFLCRRARPEKYVYYRDYAELEGAGPRKAEERFCRRDGFSASI